MAGEGKGLVVCADNRLDILVLCIGSFNTSLLIKQNPNAKINYDTYKTLQDDSPKNVLLWMKPCALGARKKEKEKEKKLPP